MLRSILQNSTAGFYVFASDSTTLTSGKTGLTITTTLSKTGGTANSVSPTITEIGNGLYWVAPIAAHRDTLGEIAWQFSGTGAIIAPRLEKVVAVNDQTARFGASDGTSVTLAADQAVNVTKFGGTAGTFSGGRPEVNTTHWAGTAVGSANVLIDGAITAAKLATDAITAAKIAADAVTEIQAGLASQTSVDTLTAYVDTEVAAIKAKTDNLPIDPADQSAVEAAITAAIATLPTAAQNADAVWDEAMAGHTTDGTYGGRVVRAANSNVTVQITGANHIAADVHEFQTDAIDADAIAASAVTELQAGLALESSLTTLTGYVDTEVAAIKAKTDNLPSDPADASDIASAFATVNNTLSTIAGYIDSEVTAIKAKTDNLPASPASETTLSALSAKLAGITLLKNWLALIMGKTADTTTRAEVNATTAGTTYNETTDALEAIRDRGDAAWLTGSSGSGSGARTVVVTVNDGTNPLQNATVRLTEGANTYLGTTDVNGQTTFNVDDATYSVAVTKSGYSFAGTTLVVNGNETLTASMSAITITPGTGSLTTGFMTILSDSGAEAEGVIVSLQMTDLPDGDEGFGYDRSVRTSTSSASGLVEFEGMVKGATYQIWRGARKHASLFTVPAGAGTTYEIPSLLGE